MDYRCKNSPEAASPDPRPLWTLAVIDSCWQGPLPPELGNISELKALYLNSNKFWGMLPPELGKLKQLERLHLNSNRFDGEIPKELGQATALVQLELHDNELRCFIRVAASAFLVMI
jgi:Leucine-rich repeat (LRR) protein